MEENVKTAELFRNMRTFMNSFVAAPAQFLETCDNFGNFVNIYVHITFRDLIWPVQMTHRAFVNRKSRYVLPTASHMTSVYIQNHTAMHETRKEDLLRE